MYIKLDAQLQMYNILIRHGQFKFKFYIRDTLMKCCQQPEGNVKFVYHL